MSRETQTAAKISATPEARDRLAQLSSEFGPLMFHTSGGRVGGRTYPILLPADALRIGARDYLLGTVEGVPVYDMEDSDKEYRIALTALVLDVAAGPAIGFSLNAGTGKRFTLRPVVEGGGCAIRSTSR